MILDATAPHTRVDNFVIDEYGDKIGAVGLAVYMVIKRHYNWTTGQCTPSYNRIAEKIKAGRSTVIRAVKQLKALGLIEKTLRFTDDGQTSNQYSFYQPERPRLAQKKTSVETNMPAQESTTAQTCPPVSEEDPPSSTLTPNQVDLNKKEKKEEAKTMPKKEEKPVSKEKTEKQQACPHPYAEVVTLFDGTTICNHCYTLLKYLPDADAA